MTILNFALFRRAKQPIVTSKPIFQHASSFINDDDEEEDLRKPAALPLPLFHNRSLSESRPSQSRPKSQSRCHLILHILAAVFATTSLTLFLTVIPIWNSNFQHTHSIVSGDYTDGLVLAPLFLSLFTSLYLIVKEHTSLGHRFRPRRSASHHLSEQGVNIRFLRPKTLALVALTFILTLAVAMTLSATSSLALVWRAPQRTKNGLIICNLANILSRPCQPLLYQIGGLQIGGIVAAALVWCIWLAILVLALRTWAWERRAALIAARAERRRRRHARRRGRGTRHGHGHEYGRNREHRIKHNDHPRTTSEPKLPTTDLAQPSRLGAKRTQYASDVWTGKEGRTDWSAPSSWDQRRDGNLATDLAAQVVRPKQTMQAWLSSRHP